MGEDEREPELLNRRARIYRCRLPPDQLNTEGFADVDLAGFMPTQGRARHSRGRQARGGVLTFDPRAGYLPLDFPQPGDPGRCVLFALDLSMCCGLGATECCSIFPVHIMRSSVYGTWGFASPFFSCMPTRVHNWFSHAVFLIASEVLFRACLTLGDAGLWGNL